MDQLLGKSEVAKRLGVSRQRVHQLRASYSDFPVPVAELACGSIWCASDIERWLARHPVRRAGVRIVVQAS